MPIIRLKTAPPEVVREKRYKTSKGIFKFPSNDKQSLVCKPKKQPDSDFTWHRSGQGCRRQVESLPLCPIEEEHGRGRLMGCGGLSGPRTDKATTSGGRRRGSKRCIKFIWKAYEWVWSALACRLEVPVRDCQFYQRLLWLCLYLRWQASCISGCWQIELQKKRERERRRESEQVKKRIEKGSFCGLTRRQSGQPYLTRLFSRFGFEQRPLVAADKIQPLLARQVCDGTWFSCSLKWMLFNNKPPLSRWLEEGCILIRGTNSSLLFSSLLGCVKVEEQPLL